MPWNIGTFRLVCLHIYQKSAKILTFHLLFYQIRRDREDGTRGGEGDDVWQHAHPREAYRPPHPSPARRHSNNANESRSQE